MDSSLSRRRPETVPSVASKSGHDQDIDRPATTNVPEPGGMSLNDQASSAMTKLKVIIVDLEVLGVLLELTLCRP